MSVGKVARLASVSRLLVATQIDPLETYQVCSLAFSWLCSVLFVSVVEKRSSYQPGPQARLSVALSATASTALISLMLVPLLP